MSHSLRTPDGLLLRPWQDDDAGAVLESFASPDMSRQSSVPITDPASATAWIARTNADRAAGAGHHWAVTDGDEVVLGAVAVSSVDRRHEEGWVSYWTLPRARGRGAAAGATRAVTRDKLVYDGERFDVERHARLATDPWPPAA